MGHLSVSASLGPGDRVDVNTRPADEEIREATVFVHFGRGVLLMFSDPESLAGLTAELVQARDWLAVEVSRQVPPPMVAEPVGDTGLTLHPLPVGEA